MDSEYRLDRQTFHAFELISSKICFFCYLIRIPPAMRSDTTGILLQTGTSSTHKQQTTAIFSSSSKGSLLSLEKIHSQISKPATPLTPSNQGSIVITLARDRVATLTVLTRSTEIGQCLYIVPVDSTSSIYRRNISSGLPCWNGYVTQENQQQQQHGKQQ